MAGNGNGDGECVMRITRAARKRAALELSVIQPQPVTKRVALSEITSFGISISSPPDLISSSNKKTHISKKKKKPAAAEKVVGSHCSDNGDPQMCSAYASDIYKYLHSMEMEEKRRPIPDYIEKIQKDLITVQMRGILVDWLVEVGEEYKLLPETLYLTVSYLDRYLSLNPLNRKRLQLLGVSCMLIASKYEEITPPHVDDFVYITDNTYTKQDVVKMEADVLKFLNFEMGNPTIKTFLQRFTSTATQTHCNAPHLQSQLEFLGCYLAELSLLDYDCIRFLPSMIAASVIFLANFTLHPNLHPWTLTLQEQSGYRASDLKHCVSAIHDLQLNTKGSSLVAIRTKYKQPKFKSVSAMAAPPHIPAHYFLDV